MRTITTLPHTADIRLRIEAESPEELFEAALVGMTNILREDFCNQQSAMTIRHSLVIDSADTTSLLIDFLSEVLTLSYTSNALFCQLAVKMLSDSHIEADVLGAPADAFDEDIKAVTYHKAEVVLQKGKWSTDIIFDI